MGVVDSNMVVEQDSRRKPSRSFYGTARICR